MDDTKVLRFPSPITTATDEAQREAARRGVELITPSPAFDVAPGAGLPLPGPIPALPEWAVGLTERAATDVEAALNLFLLSTADDEFVLGYRNSEWTGIAPMLEDDVAFSSMAQDEIGHARLFYEIVGGRLGLTADQVAYARPPEAFYNGWLLERPRTNWAFTIARQYLYDQFDTLRLLALAGGTFALAAQIAAKIVREEKYHLLYGETWLAKLAGGGAEGYGRIIAGLEAAWPLALGLFEPPPGEGLLVEAGYLARPLAELQADWYERVMQQLNRLNLPVPALDAEEGGRRGAHTPAFAPLYEELTVVYRIDPAANW